MARQSTKLSVASREAGSSRATRRLRREGNVPGVVYGGDSGPVCFRVDARELRLALAASGAVLELSVDGESATPVVLKDIQRDPVRGDTLHVDLLRVNLNKPIHATVTLELVGGEDAPGVKEGGVLEHVTRELNIEALPTDIPESIQYDVSDLNINDTVVLSAVTAPPGVTLLDDLEDTVIATVTPPRLQVEDEDEIEAETEVVGEGEAPPEAEGEAAAAPEEGGGEASESAE